MSEKFIITIARQYGSGGKTIGQMLARRLGIPCYNREIITMASEDSGINAVLFSDERLKPDLLSRLRSRYQSRGGKPVSPEEGGFTNEDNLFEYQAKIIRQLADEGPCVMIGRCADFVLRERKDVARVFVHAPDDFCLQEALKVDSLPEREVKKKIAEVDAYRAAYYRRYTGQEWKDARNYDLSLNSAVLGFEGTVEAIARYLETRAQFQTN
ncbi:cytidylate kinase-like family protein [Agathobaculum sp.]|uniref:cytidylate kinase-like family protein n=1 Tax=Agathobaculum sp. TaxID=2048138 RepID=UPI002A7FB9EC|nr:cytidylate kinase-like family protein [Agathobaculum sp.]MDY3619472.1 cytidylate kinase-like family protein [Agathobaculum sp.]